MLKRERKIMKFGSSLAVIITDHLKELGLKEGQKVTVELKNNQIVIKKG